MRLCDVCDFQGGSQPPKNEWSFEQKDGYIRMLQIRDFTQTRNVEKEYIKLTSSTKTCVTEDILIARYGASIGKILTGLSGAYNVAIILPDDAPDTQSNFIFFSSNALSAPMCDAAFIPPPQKHNPLIFNFILLKYFMS